jgi:hypothetical protein
MLLPDKLMLAFLPFIPNSAVHFLALFVFLCLVCFSIEDSFKPHFSLSAVLGH